LPASPETADLLGAGSMASMTFDFGVIGGGIAGLSVAAELAKHQTVALFERESQFGYHATGRSAALFAQCYGDATVRALTRASRKFYTQPDAGFSDVPLLRDRGELLIASSLQAERLAAVHRELVSSGGAVELESGEAARKRVPVLSRDIIGALYDPDARDIDVGALIAGFRRLLKSRAGKVFVGAAVQRIQRCGSGWRIVAGSEDVQAAVVINAAGAWADAVAVQAGLAPLGLEPRRRTAALVDLQDSIDVSAWPTVIDIDECFYFKPEVGRLLLSPADETLSEPCDAQPEDLDVAEAVARVEAATTMVIRRVSSQWAGLRTFAPDRTPVVGFDPLTGGFFWLAGQGGYGLQTAPAMARCAAALATDASVPADILLEGVEPDGLSPARLRAVG
jgi:D-arginine dehydrogenase